jgi:hypothetical protein
MCFDAWVGCCLSEDSDTDLCVCAYTLKSLRQVPFSLGMPSREVWVWLPPGYAEGMSVLHHGTSSVRLSALGLRFLFS